ncbi:hypothetical protein [Actinotalea solisilvae]|uniref:hypothetical protein n=1 Tax=Actinotalea solisilvae TaxID=2072922 RepID=UPI0018F195F4|nr:hypothetical protein [Actinotalea solisilvae]
MALDDATQSAVRALWEVATRHGREPVPVPEADPWEDDDPLDGRRAWVPVEIPGVPSVVVRLHRDGEDLVVVEDVVELDVPRRHTAAVVQELLSGRARRRLRARGFLGHLLGIALHNPLPADLVVTVDGPEPTSYEAPVVLAPGTGAWLATLATAATEPSSGDRPAG